MSLVKFSGGCGCGAVRYRYEGDSILDVNCHCRECQYASGTAYGAFRVLWREHFKFTSGEPRYYVKPSDAGNDVTRGFCAHCGAPLSFATAFRPKLILLTAASLDEPSLYAPVMNIFTGSAQHWDIMDSAIENYDRAPEYPAGLGQ